MDGKTARRMGLLLLLLVGAFGLAHLGRAPSDAATRTAAPETPQAPRRPERSRGRPAAPPPPSVASGHASTPSPDRPPLRLSPTTVRRTPEAGMGTMRGRVLAWGSTRPVPGAEVSFDHGGATLSVRTDAGGIFRFTAPEPGPYRLALVVAEGFLPFAPAWGHSPIRFVAAPGVLLDDVTLFLVDAIPYQGRVLGADGAPVEGAAVQLFGVATAEQALVPLERAFVSDAEGRFRFHAPDDAVLEAVHPDLGFGRAVVDAAAQVTRELVLRLESAPPATSALTGVVLGTEGPVGGASLVAVPASRSASAIRPARAALSDIDGTFAIEGLEDGGHVLVATAPGHARRSLEVTLPRGPIEVTLEGEARLEVTARHAGAPVAAFTVAVLHPDGPLAREVVATASAYDGDGRLELGGLPPGPHLVQVLAPDLARSEARSVILRAGATATLQVALDAGARLSGRVVDAAEGTPLAGARVTLEGLLGRGASARPVATSALTGDDGRFALMGVPPGPASVAVWASGYHGRLRSARVGPEGADLGDIDLAALEEGERPQLELAGIGAILAAEGDAMIINGTVDGGGAREAGLQVGDGILEVDGQPVVDLGFAGTIEAIRGPEGTSVALRVRRADGTVETVRVRRRRVRA